ncbi:thermonuclease family protein [Niallia taxi]|nr:thermonuclease family protein [Niallia taxi]MDE5055359.1 thermonuclease family protein [Niallia taxi]
MRNFKKVFMATSVVILLNACSSNDLVEYADKQTYEVAKDTVVESSSFLDNLINGTDQTQEASNESMKTVIVERVIDGDTIEFQDGSKARLLSINTPEITKGKNEPYGQEAQEFLAHLVEGKEIQIESDSKAGETDKYGRLLVHAFIGGKSIQYMLVAEGLAKVAYLYDDYEYTDLYKDAEDLAKNKSLNIWSISGYADSEDNVFNTNVVQKSLLDGASSSVNQVMDLFNDAKEILKR